MVCRACVPKLEMIVVPKGGEIFLVLGCAYCDDVDHRRL